MKKYFYITAGFLLSLIILFQGCSEEPLPSLYDSVTAGKPTPQIISISPDVAYAGVTHITVTGSNFSTVPEDNSVFFNGRPGKVLSATPDQLVVLPANVVSDSTPVKVSVRGADEFSNILKYKLIPAYAEVKRTTEAEHFTKDIVPFGLTTDAQGNVYTSVVMSTIGVGIKKISPSGTSFVTGEMVDFAPKGGETSFPRMNMWQNNTILAARRVTAVFEIVEGTAAKVFQSQGLTAINDIDFDQDLNVWAGGKGLFRITPSKQVKSFPYTDDIKSIRIFNNYVYILTTSGGSDLIRRLPINGEDLGPAEDVFNIGQAVPPDSADFKIEGTDFEIAADGDIVLGTTKKVNSILIVKPDGSYEPLYPVVIPDNTKVYAFDWGPGQYLYLTREADASKPQSIYRLSMQREGAPHYGR
jgi:hypothetical protein